MSPGVAARSFSASLAPLLVALASCSQLEPGPDLRRELVESWGHDVLLPTYAEFEAGARDLELRSAELCADPDADGVEAARRAWWDARAPWKRADVFALGPYQEEPLRLGPKIDFWPPRPEAVQEVLASSDALDAASVARLGAPARGMPALEYLLYGDDAASGAELFATEPRRCEYLLALGADLTALAVQMREAWDPEHGDFLGELVNAGRTSERYPSMDLALGELVNRMAYTLENVQRDKLGGPAGIMIGGAPQPELAESRYSGRSIEDIRDNLRGVERLYTGDPAAGEPGLHDLLRRRGRNFSRVMSERLAAAHAELDRIDQPLSVAVVDDPESVLRGIERLSELQRLIQVDMGNTLSVPYTFNDADGD